LQQAEHVGFRLGSPGAIQPKVRGHHQRTRAGTGPATATLPHGTRLTTRPGDPSSREVDKAPSTAGPRCRADVQMKSQRASGCLFLGSDIQEKPRGPSRSMSRGDGDGHGHGTSSWWSEAPFYFGRRKRPTVNLDFAFPMASDAQRGVRRCVAQRHRADECDAEHPIGTALSQHGNLPAGHRQWISRDSISIVEAAVVSSVRVWCGRKRRGGLK